MTKRLNEPWAEPRAHARNAQVHNDVLLLNVCVVLHNVVISISIATKRGKLASPYELSHKATQSIADISQTFGSGLGASSASSNSLPSKELKSGT
jgi:hypothetical protein